MAVQSMRSTANYEMEPQTRRRRIPKVLCPLIGLVGFVLVIGIALAALYPTWRKAAGPAYRRPYDPKAKKELTSSLFYHTQSILPVQSNSMHPATAIATALAHETDFIYYEDLIGVDRQRLPTTLQTSLLNIEDTSPTTTSAMERPPESLTLDSPPTSKTDKPHPPPIYKYSTRRPLATPMIITISEQNPPMLGYYFDQDVTKTLTATHPPPLPTAQGPSREDVDGERGGRGRGMGWYEGEETGEGGGQSRGGGREGGGIWDPDERNKKPKGEGSGDAIAKEEEKSHDVFEKGSDLDAGSHDVFVEKGGPETGTHDIFREGGEGPPVENALEAEHAPPEPFAAFEHGIPRKRDQTEAVCN